MESYAFAAVFIIVGILTSTGKPVGMGRFRDRYTPESLGRFLPWAGLSEIILGVGSIIQEIKNTPMNHLVGWLVSVSGILLFIILMGVILVKRR